MSSQQTWNIISDQILQPTLINLLVWTLSLSFFSFNFCCYNVSFHLDLWHLVVTLFIFWLVHQKSDAQSTKIFTSQSRKQKNQMNNVENDKEMNFCVHEDLGNLKIKNATMIKEIAELKQKMEIMNFLLEKMNTSIQKESKMFETPIYQDHKSNEKWDELKSIIDLKLIKNNELMIQQLNQLIRKQINISEINQKSSQINHKDEDTQKIAIEKLRKEKSSIEETVQLQDKNNAISSINEDILLSVLEIHNTSEVPIPSKDWHIILGHPSDVYLKNFFEINSIKFSKNDFNELNCEICKSVKLHSTLQPNPLPEAPAPFHTLHVDLIQIDHLSKNGLQYVLVIIDDYTRFNRIYILRNESEAESRILNYISEILNKVNKCPSVIKTHKHCALSSKVFLSTINKLGIHMDCGLSNDSLKDCLTERFNRFFLNKIRVIIAQSSVPLNYWDEAAKYASMLLNILPSAALNWYSPLQTLHKNKVEFEPIKDISKLVPFGLKCLVHQESLYKFSSPTKPLLCLGYEPHSDNLRLLDTLKSKIIVSKDYTPTNSNFKYGDPSVLKKPLRCLPCIKLPHKSGFKDYLPKTNLPPWFKYNMKTKAKASNSLPQVYHQQIPIESPPSYVLQSCGSQSSPHSIPMHSHFPNSTSNSRKSQYTWKRSKNVENGYE